jgi:L1 cell adhesion molecule like protein
LADDLDLCYLLKRKEFEEINEQYFNKLLPIVEECLKDGKVDKLDVHDVVMVGGSTRVPRVREILQEYFLGMKLDHTVNPDEAVAHGAAIIAAQKNEPE